MSAKCQERTRTRDAVIPAGRTMTAATGAIKSRDALGGLHLTNTPNYRFSGRLVATCAIFATDSKKIT
jgi:hypothetical protein